ncbi:hypothetical protein ACFQS2_11405 [Brachybacterium sp. GCM10030267]|uniref:hypothetical protein n=1 Tax=unclassified Brachybacterium TaxID=2623841 RepID=UPI00361BDB7D
MNGSDRRPQQQPGQGRTTVSPLAIPLLFAGLMIGFFAGYFFLWWGILAVLAVALGALWMVLAGHSREAAASAIGGVAVGYVILLLLAVFRGVL